MVLYGRHAVAAALANTGRSVAKLLCTKENAAEFQDLANNRHIPLNIVDRKEIDKLLPREAVHQGVALVCSERPACNLKMSLP